jgi:hypothetical protein
MTGNGGLIAEEGLAEEMFLPVEGTLAMSVAGGFCCKSQLRQAANRDSVLLTRISARSIHDGPSEE